MGIFECFHVFSFGIANSIFSTVSRISNKDTQGLSLYKVSNNNDDLINIAYYSIDNTMMYKNIDIKYEKIVRECFLDKPELLAHFVLYIFPCVSVAINKLTD